MERQIKNRFSNAILHQARHRYGIGSDNICLLDSFMNFVYSFKKEGKSYILRIGHSLRRSPEMILGELDWINFLTYRGVSVAKAVLSDNGQLVERIDDGHGGQFLATAFVKASGGPAGEISSWTEPLIVNYGRLLGRIHALSKNYCPQNPAWQRPHWNDLTDNDRLYVLSHTNSVLWQRFKTIFNHLSSLPRDPDSYGMIHQDAYGGNFFVDEDGRITLFDFDDCVFGHFAYDLAIALFSAVTNQDDDRAFGSCFWTHFWYGYRQENYLDQRWLAQIPYFMKLREIHLYSLVLRDIGPCKIDDPWLAQFMRGRQERIENDVPCLAFPLG